MPPNFRLDPTILESYNQAHQAASKPVIGIFLIGVLIIVTVGLFCSSL